MSDTSGSKILRVGLLNEVHHLDPQSANDNESMWVLRQVLEMPYEIRAGHAEVEPVLFEGPLEVLDGSDNRRYRGKVREGIRFADGEPVTPAHVVQCLRQASLAKEQAEVTQDGDHLIFDLRRANARFDVMLTHQQCAVYRLENGRVCATGPFQISQDSTPGHLRLVRNPYYRQELKLDEIHFRVYPVDGDGRPTALVRAIQQGEVDFCSVLPRDDISRLSGVRKSFLPGISTAMLSMNCARPPLDDANLRRALAHSINRLKVAESCYSNGLAFTATSILPRGLVAVDDDLVYDVRKARACLEEAGKPLPKKLSGLMTWGPRPYLPNPTGAAEVISQHLAELGVTVEWTRPPNSSDFFQRCIDGRHELVLAGWVSDTIDPSDFLEASLASERVPTWENLAVSTNHAHYRSPRMDEKLAQYRAQGDMGTLEEVMEVLTEEAPLVPLIYGASASVLSFKVLGFQPSPLGTQKLVHLDLKR
jgi:ABC-type transport system substrate-binding protein